MSVMTGRTNPQKLNLNKEMRRLGGRQASDGQVMATCKPVMDRSWLSEGQ